MRRYLGWIAIAWMIVICGLALAFYGSPASAQSLDARTRAVAEQLRCPVCHGESVADSSAQISADMRVLIRQWLARGKSPDQIKAYFVSRYGTWILLAPPSSGVGSLAWWGPPLLALGGLALLVTLVVDWRKRGSVPLRPARAEYLRRVRAEVVGKAEE